jgi:hypothetical protein
LNATLLQTAMLVDHTALRAHASLIKFTYFVVHEDEATHISSHHDVFMVAEVVDTPATAVAGI